VLERFGETFFALVGGGRMIIELNATHDPSLRSWATSANIGGTDFSIQNLAFAVFRRAGAHEEFRGGVAIGDQILDLRAAYQRNLSPTTVKTILGACSEPTLNRCMTLGPEASTNLRRWLSDALREGSPVSAHLQSDLVPQSEAEFALPANIGDYTDFNTSIHHATALSSPLFTGTVGSTAAFISR
jgi:fumarylacetoacetase